MTFDDGGKLGVRSVIWATGFRPDYSWIELPVFDPDGRVHHRRGVTEMPGLYFLGLTWQYTRGSALLGWVKEDAEFIAERVAFNAGEEKRLAAAAHEGRTDLSASSEALVKEGV